MDESGELNRLVRELNEGRGTEPADAAATATLDQWLAGLVEKGGSDLLLVEGAPPCVRVQGEVKKIDANALDGADIEAAVLPALSRHALQVYRERSIADASYRIEGVGRFRINLHRERGRAAAAIRALPTRVPGLAGTAFARSGGEPGTFAARVGTDRWSGGVGKIDDAVGVDSRD